MSAPQRRMTFGERMKYHDDQNIDFYGLIRQKITTPRSINAPIAGEASPAPESGTGFLRTVGDTMIGPIAYFPGSVTISAGQINVSQAFGSGYHSLVVINGQGAVNDDLDTILNATFAGQILILQTVAGQTITLKHLTGNIRCSTGADIALAPQTSIQLYFDAVANQWTDVQGFSTTGGGGPFANTALSNLTATAVNASLIPALDATIDLGSSALAWDELFVGAVKFPNQKTVVGTEWSIQRDGADDIVTNVPTGEQFLWSINAINHMALSAGWLQIINPTSVMTVDLINRNPAIIDLNQIGEIRFRADDDAVGENIQTYVRILANADDVSSGTIDGRLSFAVAENNVLTTYITLNLLGGQGIIFERPTLHDDVYADFGNMAVPANPPAGKRRLFSDSGNFDHLSVRTAGGSTIDLEATAGGVFANQQLSNLTVGGVQINTDLVPDMAFTHRLGTASLPWSSLNVRTITLHGSFPPSTIEMEIGRYDFGSGNPTMFFHIPTGDDIRFIEGAITNNMLQLEPTNTRAVFGRAGAGNPIKEIKLFGVTGLEFWDIIAPGGGSTNAIYSVSANGHQFDQFVQFGNIAVNSIRIDPGGDADFNANNIVDINNITTSSSGIISGFADVKATKFSRITNANIFLENLASGWTYNAELGDTHVFNLSGLPIVTIADTAVTMFSGVQLLVNDSLTLTSATDAYLDFSDIPVPPTPFGGFGRVFFDNSSSPGILKIKKDDGTVVSLEAGGGSQTPWLSNINAQQFDLLNIKTISGRDTGAIGSFKIVFDANEDSDTWIGDSSNTDEFRFVANGVVQARVGSGGFIFDNSPLMNSVYTEWTSQSSASVPTPPIGQRNLFVNSGTGKISVKTDAGNVISLEEGGAGISWSTPVDANIIPDGDNNRDLGSAGVEFRDLYLDGIAYIDTLQIDVNAIFNGTITGNANMTLGGNVTFLGNVTLGNASTDDIDVNGSFVDDLFPKFTNNYDVGSSALRWRTFYGFNVDILTSVLLANSAGSVGFFGHTPITKRTVADANPAPPFTAVGFLQLVGVVNAILGALGSSPTGYGLLNVT